MEEIILTSKNFEEEVLKSEGKVLVDFWATWCAPCRMLAPELESFAFSQDEVKVGKVNVDEESSLAVKYGVNVIPTMILFENGEELKRRSGYCKQADIEEFVK
ncbi:MAG TPA: thioredoxin [Clostridiales bacterium]|nr:thioredoxin [Clostridiales bacterium]